MQTKRHFVWLALGAATIVLAGCPKGQVVPERTETVIEGSHRLATSPDGKLTLDFTRGSIEEGTTVTIGMADAKVDGLVGRAYDLGPEGLTFSGPVTIRMALKDYTPKGTMVLANLDGASPAVVQGSTWDPSTGTLTGNLQHFSTYGALDIHAPCAGKACGEPCDPCDPNDPSCVAPGATTFCDANGACVPGNPQTITCDGRTYDPCAGKSCGETCSLCPPGDANCVEPQVVLTCNDRGLCGMDQPVCGDYVPCANKACGEPCTICPPGDPTCVEPDVVMSCDATGACVYAGPNDVLCDIAPPPSECSTDSDCAVDEICVGTSWCPPCANGGQSCGAPCAIVGTCEPVPNDPCAGKSCGEACNPCLDANGACPTVMGVCNANGACVMPTDTNAVDCGGTVPPSECSSDAECPTGTACLPYEWCPDCMNADPPCEMPCYAGRSCQPVGTDCQNLACGDVCTTAGGALGLCDANGTCVQANNGAAPTCPGGTYDPCSGKTCGEPCTLCDPNDPTCVETDVLKVCDATGACVVDAAGSNAVNCGTQPPSSQCSMDSDCATGEVCVVQTWCPDCVSANPPCLAPCVAYGTCQPGGSLPYDPCRGKVCGDTCTLCDPSDPNCVETAVVKFCDANGGCSATVPACGVDGDPCGGFANLGCAPGYICVDDPTDKCDPNAGGTDCIGICQPDPCLGGPTGCSTPCSSDADCAAGQVCVNGTCH